MQKKYVFLVVAFFSLTTLLTGCGSSHMSTSTGATVVQFLITTPTTATAGSPFTFTVTAADANGNTVTNYTGSVSFSSSDSQAVLPSSSQITGGVGAFTATLKTAGPTSTYAPAITALGLTTNPVSQFKSSTITVSPASASTLAVKTSSLYSVGYKYDIAVTAYDAYGNVATGDSDTISFTSSDAKASLPVSSALTKGVGTFQAALNTLGAQTITAADSSASSVTSATTGEITVTDALVVTVDDIPEGMVGKPYTFGDKSLSISGGSGSYTASYTNAPSGLEAGSDGFSLVGAPEASGSTSVSVLVTDASTNAKGSATFLLPVVAAPQSTNNTAFYGAYTCYVEQFWDTPYTISSSYSLYRGGMVFSMTADGAGGVTINEGDGNSLNKGYFTFSGESGSYAVGSNNRGALTFSAAIDKTTVFALAGGNTSTAGYFLDVSLTEMDDVGASPSGVTGAGHCYRLTSTPGSSMSGVAYVFSAHGEDSQGYAAAAVGQIAFATGTSGYAVTITQDAASGLNSEANTATSATAGSVDQYGRMMIKSGSNYMVIYLASSPSSYNNTNYAVIMSAPSHYSPAEFLIGAMRQQNSTVASLSYPAKYDALMYTQGVGYCPSAATKCTPGAKNYRVVLRHIYSQNGNRYYTDSVYKNLGGVIVFDPSPDPEGMYKSYWDFTWSTSGGNTAGRAVWSNGVGGAPFYLYYADYNVAAALEADTSLDDGYQQALNGWVEPAVCTDTYNYNGKLELAWESKDFPGSYFMSKIPNGSASTGMSVGSLAMDNAGGASSGGTGSLTEFSQDSGASQWASWGEGFSNSVNSASFILDVTGGQSAVNYDGMDYGLIDITVTGASSFGAMCYNITESATALATAGSTCTYYGICANPAKGKFACVNVNDSAPAYYILQE